MKPEQWPRERTACRIGALGAALLALLCLVIGGLAVSNRWEVAGTLLKSSVVSSREDQGRGYSCATSLKATYGFLCEPDDMWALKKKVFDMQEKNQAVLWSNKWFSQDIRMFMQTNYEPEFSCSLERRIGHVGEGGLFGLGSLVR